MVPLRAFPLLMGLVAVVPTFGCGELSRNPVSPDAVTVSTTVSSPTDTTAALAVEKQTAARPLTESRPFQAICEAQGGEFNVAVDFRSLYCNKAGGLFTAFTENQLRTQRTICEHVYGAFFGVQGILPNSTGTFCSTATPG